MRKFAVAKGFEDKGVNLPQRATKNAAGYDFEAVEDIVVPSIWFHFVPMFLKKMANPNIQLGTLVHTGVKAYMENDEYLGLYSRSSKFA